MDGNTGQGYGNMPLPEMINLSDRVNNYIAEAAGREKEGDFENALLFYELAIHADPQRLDSHAAKLGALISLKQQKIGQGAPEDDISHIDGVIADAEKRLGIPHLAQQ